MPAGEAGDRTYRGTLSHSEAEEKAVTVVGDAASPVFGLGWKGWAGGRAGG